MQKLSSEVVILSLSGGTLCALHVCWRWMTFGRTLVMGMTLNPSSNLACVAVLTRVVSGLHQSVLLVVHGAHPRNTPLREFGFSLAGFFPGGQTQTLHPNVRKLLKSPRFPVARVMGEAEVECQVGMAFCTRRE